MSTGVEWCLGKKLCGQLEAAADEEYGCTNGKQSHIHLKQILRLFVGGNQQNYSRTDHSAK